MNKCKIIFFIYNQCIYIKKDSEIDIISLDDNVLKKGRINSPKCLIKNLKKSKLVLSSFFKIVNDNFVMIYFNDYNIYELNNIKKELNENGLENIKLVDVQSIINVDKYCYIILNNNSCYVLNKLCKIIIPDNVYNLEYANSKIIIDLNMNKKFKKKLLKYQYYVIDDLAQYLFNNIC